MWSGLDLTIDEVREMFQEVGPFTFTRDIAREEVTMTHVDPFYEDDMIVAASD